jgi:hypothetical protein
VQNFVKPKKLVVLAPTLYSAKPLRVKSIYSRLPWPVAVATTNAKKPLIRVN